MTTFSFNNNPISDNLANYANLNGLTLLIAKFIIIFKPEINKYHNYKCDKSNY